MIRAGDVIKYTQANDGWRDTYKVVRVFEWNNLGCHNFRHEGAACFCAEIKGYGRYHWTERDFVKVCRATPHNCNRGEPCVE